MAAAFFIIAGCKKKNSCDYETQCIEPEPAGFMVGTMNSTPTSNWVGTVFKTQQNSLAPIGDDWNDPALGTGKVVSVHPSMWTPSAIGQVFGIALDNNSGIYLSASDVYKYDSAYTHSLTSGTFVLTTVASGYGPAGAAGIYYTNYSTLGTTIPLVLTQPFPYINTVGTNKIPNSGTGTGNSIGNIAFDYKNNQLFATNLEDGRIYRINPVTGVVKSIFDPFTIDPGSSSPGMANSDEQLWGVGVLTQAGTTSVYFSRSTLANTKEIWSIPLTASGEFAATAAGGGLYTDISVSATKKEIAPVPGSMNKVTDIAFSSTGRMLLAERGHPHAAGMLEYAFSGTSWVPGNNFYLGADLTSGSGFLFGKNSAGGVDYSNRELPNSIPNFLCNNIVWGTGNAMATTKLPYNPPTNTYPNWVYGAQGMSSGGNSTPLIINSKKDLYIDYNCTGWPHQTNVKGKIGDIEFFKPTCPCK